MRQLIEEDCDRFADGALNELRSPHHSPGHQYALTLLVSNNLIMKRLCDPDQLATPDAIRLARQISSGIDSLLDMKLIRQLLPQNGSPPAVTGEAQSLRILDLVDAISDGGRVMALLTQLLRHPSPKVRSKVSLLIGRINRNLTWVEQRLLEPDSRVRANSVEALWGLESREACEMFRRALADPDNRVAGNGAVGLYQAGETDSVPAMVGMLSHSDPRFRATAVWAMGQTEDPRFLPYLTSHEIKQNAALHKQAHRAAARIRQRVKTAEAGPRLSPAISGVTDHGPLRRVHFAVTAGHRIVTGLRPLEIVLADSGKAIDTFTLLEHREPELISVACIVPSSSGTDDRWTPAITEAFRWLLEGKRRSDAWAISRYRERVSVESVDFRFDQALLASGSGSKRSAVVESQSDERLEAVKFTPESKTLLDEINGTGKSSRPAASLGSALGNVLPALSAARGAKHIYFFANAPLTSEESTSFAERAHQAHVVLSGFALGFTASDTMKALCDATGGGCTSIGDPGGLPAAVARAGARMHSLYSVEYETSPGERGPITLQIYAQRGYGADTLD